MIIHHAILHKLIHTTRVRPPQSITFLVEKSNLIQRIDQLCLATSMTRTPGLILASWLASSPRTGLDMRSIPTIYVVYQLQ